MSEDKYKHLKPKGKKLPPRRTSRNAQCVNRAGILKRSFSEKKAKARAKELNMRAYPCDKCVTLEGFQPWHLTKKTERPRGSQ